MNKSVVDNIKSKIYEVRGKQVMLDSDLAELYECKNGTKTINQAVNRHLDRFPNDFYFQLTKDEYMIILRSQTGTLELKQGKYSKYAPYVFTEQGVAMLAAVLRTNIASKVSINIMRAFVEMRHFISNNLLEQRYINNMVLEHDNDIKLLQECFDSFKEKNNHIFFKGEIYDAYSLLIDILNKSKNEIILIDNYINKNLLDILSKIDKKIIIITNDYNNDDYLKYNKQYNNIKLIVNNDFHDRFIIIDKKELYHSGSSFKDLGNKCFEITKIEDNNILELLLNKIV